jgi:hypothetical protein
MTKCAALSAEILTQRGWLTHEQVRVGDETLGYNPETKCSEWTTITKVVHYKDAEVWRIGNKHWHAEVTPNHRWWSDTRFTRKPETLAVCPECGWTGRTDRGGRDITPTPRSISTHRGRVHGVQAQQSTSYRGEFATTDALKSDHRIRLAAPADTDGIPGLSLDEVRIIAWLQGDGTVSPVLAKPVICPECGWLPGTGRKPHQGPLTQEATSVAVHRAKKHGMGKDRTHGVLAGYDGTIWQSKPAQIVKLRVLLAIIEHTESVRQRPGNTQPAHAFRLRRAYVTELVKRSRLMETGAEAFVLMLSPDQRAAWLDAMIDAEGHRMPGKKAAHREFVRIAQVNGPLQDAIKLAVFLEGYRPTFSANSAERNGYKPAGVVGMAQSHVVPVMFNEPKVLGRQEVWCVKTRLETWTARQDGQVFLTGAAIPAS